MRLSILHEIRYEYDGPVTSNRNIVRISPHAGPRQTVETSRITTDPPGIFRPYLDAYENLCNLIHVARPHHRLTITGTFVATRIPREIRGTVPEGLGLMGLHDFLLPIEHEEFLEGSRETNFSEEVWAASDRWRAAGVPDLHQLCLAIAREIQSTFSYRPGATMVGTTSSEVWKTKEGVCQDFAHAMISLLRALGIPARYVSGYIISEGMMHAWVQAYIPGPGWVDYDPTHGRVVDEEYIAVAVGRDYADCCPIEGTLLGARLRGAEFRVAVRPVP